MNPDFTMDETFNLAKIGRRSPCHKKSLPERRCANSNGGRKNAVTQ
jgi:hypothetical protein